MPSQLDSGSPAILADAPAAATPPRDPDLRVAWAAELLCDQRKRELRLAASYRECTGLTPEQLEDLFQDTAIALLSRPFENAEHLYRALRSGMKYRALRMHRDERSRRAILARRAPVVHALTHAQANETDPERILLTSEDRYLIKEFTAELTPSEQHLLRLTAEGVSTRRLAKALGVSAQQLYTTKVTYERKRENYTLLYSTGRLCEFRAGTIARMKEHQTTSPQLAERAIAHLQGCPRCRAEHQITAQRLRHAFEQQASALLPLPVILTHTSLLARLLTHIKLPARHQRTSPLHASQARLAMTIANTNTTTRVAAPIAATLLTASAIGITHALTHDTPHPQHDTATPHAITAPPPTSPPAARKPLPSNLTSQLRPPHLSTASTHPFGPGRAISLSHKATTHPTPSQHIPGGFTYLGVPTTPNNHPQPPQQQTERPGGGGEFSP